MGCFVCDRIEAIRRGENPYFVAELSTGYVVIGDHQRFYGYTLFLCREHKAELSDLGRDFRLRFLDEMSLVAEAVQRAFHAEKMNIESLGNGIPHLHWHLFPRRNGDMPVKGPVWWLPKEEMYDDRFRPDEKQLADMIALLRAELKRLQVNFLA